MQRALLVALFCLLPVVAVAAPPRSPTLGGNLHGGQQAVVGAQVYLFEPGLSIGAPSRSILKNVPGTTQADSAGNYFVYSTAPSGSFTVTGDYTCDANEPVYVYASGGNPEGTGSYNNSAIGLLALAGICPPSGGVLPASTFIFVNEVSTVAVAYALAGYGSGPEQIAYSGTAAGLQGITNAFLNVNNLVTQSTGYSFTSTPSNYAAVPETLIYTLADILASCVNNASATNQECATLFDSATGNGTASGSLPSETATAAVNIAHHPGTQNSTALLNLITPNAPYQPTLTSAPSDWTISLLYQNNGIEDPYAIAIDGAGNAWIANVTKFTSYYNEPGYTGSGQGGSVVEISATGNVLSGTSGWASSYFSEDRNTPTAIAIDTSGNAWITTYTTVSQVLADGTLNSQEFLNPNTVCPAQNGQPSSQFMGASGIAFDRNGNAWVAGPPVFELSPSGQNLSGSCGYSYNNMYGPIGTAVDQLNNIWTVDFGSDEIVRLNPNGTVAGYYSDSTTIQPNGIAIDQNNNVWIANFGTDAVTKIAGGTYSIVSPIGGYYGHGLYDDAAVAIDGSSNAWFTPSANGNNIGAVELNSLGQFQSGTNGYETGASDNQQNGHFSTAIDGSGNVWVANTYTQSVSELIGAATPVVTPLASGVANLTLARIP